MTRFTYSTKLFSFITVLIAIVITLTHAQQPTVSSSRPTTPPSESSPVFVDPFHPNGVSLDVSSSVSAGASSVATSASSPTPTAEATPAANSTTAVDNTTSTNNSTNTNTTTNNNNATSTTNTTNTNTTSTNTTNSTAKPSSTFTPYADANLSFLLRNGAGSPRFKNPSANNVFLWISSSVLLCSTSTAMALLL